MPPPAQCTIQASRMMARTIRTSHATNHTIPGMAYPLMVLVLATTASYPPMPELIGKHLRLRNPSRTKADRPAAPPQVRATRRGRLSAGWAAACGAAGLQLGTVGRIHNRPARLPRILRRRSLATATRTVLLEIPSARAITLTGNPRSVQPAEFRPVRHRQHPFLSGLG